MMTKLYWVTGGGDQEKFTCLCPKTASNISGVPVYRSCEFMHEDKIYYIYITEMADYK